jgi:hypothetical protein
MAGTRPLVCVRRKHKYCEEDTETRRNWWGSWTKVNAGRPSIGVNADCRTILAIKMRKFQVRRNLCCEELSVLPTSVQNVGEAGWKLDRTVGIPCESSEIPLRVKGLAVCVTRLEQPRRTILTDDCWFDDAVSTAVFSPPRYVPRAWAVQENLLSSAEIYHDHFLCWTYRLLKSGLLLVTRHLSAFVSIGRCRLSVGSAKWLECCLLLLLLLLSSPLRLRLHPRQELSVTVADAKPSRSTGGTSPCPRKPHCGSYPMYRRNWPSLNIGTC